MKNKEFEAVVIMHSLKPGNALYNTVGLVGEAGEVANIIKKIAIRKTIIAKGDPIISLNTMEEYIASIKDELGDVLFYLTRLALDYGLDLDEIMEEQNRKLLAQNKEYNKVFKK